MNRHALIIEYCDVVVSHVSINVSLRLHSLGGVSGYLSN